MFVAGHGDFAMLGGESVRRAWLGTACVEEREREYTWWWPGVGKMLCQIPAWVACPVLQIADDRSPFPADKCVAVAISIF